VLTKWNGASFDSISYPVTDYLSVQLCVSSYALLLGVIGSSARNVLQRIKDKVPLNWPGVSEGTGFLVTSAVEQRHKESLARTMLQQYVSTHLVKSNEMQPAPGAHRQVETVLNASTWKHKWDNCVAFFTEQTGEQVGTQKMFKEVFNREKRLKERRAMSHSKCDLCKKIDVEAAKLKGDNRPWARDQAAKLKRAKQEHEGRHLSSRSVFDQHGFLALTNPENVWCMCCDAATARNMELPRHNGVRMAKSAAGTMPKFKLKLTATYAFGYGFIPYLSHESLHHGPNLVWTVIWLSICRLKKHYGGYPDLLFLLLDNTTGENKTEVMLAFASWLVGTKRVKQVRVFFLYVGHTHIIIDQIFGVITVNLRGKPILLPERLMSLIDQAVAKNPQYQGVPVQWLRSLFDFWAFTKEMKTRNTEGLFKRPEITDEAGKYAGMSDFTFKHDSEHLALLQYREQHDFAWRPEGAGIPIITTLPTKPPPLVKTDSYAKWGKIGTLTLETTVNTFLSFATLSHREEREIRERWDEHIAEIPTVTELLKPEYKLTFEDFNYNPDVPRIAFSGPAPEQDAGGTSADGTTADEEMEYRVWLQTTFAGHRSVPFAYDPVVSSQQSAKNYMKARSVYEMSLLAGTGPTSSRQSLVIGGAFLFGALRGSVALFKIQDIGKMQTPRSTDPKLSCSLYEHTVQTGVSGFFGTFRSAPAGTGKVTLERDDVLVYNVSFATASRTVSLESLRVLAAMKPLEYAIPDPIPESHLPARSGDDSSSSEEEEFHFEIGGGTKRASKSKKHKKRVPSQKKQAGGVKEKRAKGPAVPPPQRPRRTSGAASGAYAGNDSSDEDDAASSSESPVLSPSCSGSEDAGAPHDSAEEDETNDAVPAGSAVPADPAVPVVPALPAPEDWCPNPETLAFVLRDDNRENPIDLVWVEQLSSDRLVTVYWFGTVDLKCSLLRSTTKVTFHKHWNTRDMVQLEINLGLRYANKTKKRGQQRKEPTKELMAKYWSNDTYSVSSGVFVPVLVPSPPAASIWKCDATVTLKQPFLRETLLPALEQLRKL
jgi:hypothetical protein